MCVLATLSGSTGLPICPLHGILLPSICFCMPSVWLPLLLPLCCLYDAHPLCSVYVQCFGLQQSRSPRCKTFHKRETCLDVIIIPFTQLHVQLKHYEEIPNSRCSNSCTAGGYFLYLFPGRKCRNRGIMVLSLG